MQLLQLIIFKEEEEEIGKTYFNKKQLHLSQYMSTLCWIVLTMTAEEMVILFEILETPIHKNKNRAIFFIPV